METSERLPNLPFVLGVQSPYQTVRYMMQAVFFAYQLMLVM